MSNQNIIVNNIRVVKGTPTDCRLTPSDWGIMYRTSVQISNKCRGPQTNHGQHCIILMLINWERHRVPLYIYKWLPWQSPRFSWRRWQDENNLAELISYQLYNLRTRRSWASLLAGIISNWSGDIINTPSPAAQLFLHKRMARSGGSPTNKRHREPPSSTTDRVYMANFALRNQWRRKILE